MAERSAPAARPAAVQGDDLIVPFEAEGLDARGRLVRLGPAVDAILARHAYPAPVSRLLGEAIALTALLGASLKFDGRFILQTQGDGPVSMLVADFGAPDTIRACATFDADALAAAGEHARDPAALLGTGHLAMTIDQGGEGTRYQGVVPLDGRSLAAAADLYFRQSEQIPTLVRLAVAEQVTPAAPGGSARTAWRAGGLLLQHLPRGDRAPARDLPPGDAPRDWPISPGGGEPERWVEARALAATVEDHELTDPTLTPERLLFRLFHERGVRLFGPQPVRDACRCSRERIEEMLLRFTPEERADMVAETGEIVVTCHFCSARYHFAPGDFPSA